VFLKFQVFWDVYAMTQGKQFAVFEGLQCLCLYGQQAQEQLHCLALKIKVPLSFEFLKTPQNDPKTWNLRVYILKIYIKNFLYEKFI